MDYSSDSSNDYDSDDGVEYELDEDQPPEPNNFEFDTNEPMASLLPNLEPELEVKTRIESQKLAELQAQIRSRAIIPKDPNNPTVLGFKKLPRTWPPRPFQPLLLLPFTSITTPIHFFTLFFTDEVFNTLVSNTNAYAEAKNARVGCYGKGRLWRSVSQLDLQVYIALLIYMGVCGSGNIESFWQKKGSLANHKPMLYMPLYRF